MGEITKKEAIEELNRIRFSMSARACGTERFNAALTYAIERFRKEQNSKNNVETVKKELLEHGDETISFRDLVERFDYVDRCCGGDLWDLTQIYNNFAVVRMENGCTCEASKMGKWIRCINDDDCPAYKCTKCGYVNSEASWNEKDYNYCPKCGQKIISPDKEGT